MPKFNKWLSSLLRNKEKLEEIAITTVNAECSAIIMNKVLEKLEDPGKFLIPCSLQELNRTNALADFGAIINLLPHSIYKKLGLEALSVYYSLYNAAVVSFSPTRDDSQLSRIGGGSLQIELNTEVHEDSSKLKELIEFWYQISNKESLTVEYKDCSSSGDYKFETENEGLGEEDTSKQWRIADIDVDARINLLLLAQALDCFESAKPKADKVMLQEPKQGIITTTTASTTVTAASTRPKAKGLVIHEEEQATTPTVSLHSRHNSRSGQG
ncbi:hypothetical protein Tco_0841312 [Tanacetum coccineum]|uniref:Uncharacterized protein n=1 Tax=Tanacetum coccineum TaxID=301880 RepID=A0ABQ5AW08_9ASTR